MKRSVWFRNQVLLLFLLLFFSFPSFAKPRHLVVLHTNDIHGQVLSRKFKERVLTGNWSDTRLVTLSGSAGLFSAIQKIRNDEGKKNVLMMDAGDIYQGTPESNFTKGALSIAIMNEISYDVMTMGNHDLDHGFENLQSLARHASFPILAANMRKKDGDIPSNIGDFRAFHRAGLNIAVIGITTTRIPEITIAHQGDPELHYLDEAKTAQKMIEKAKQEDADVILLLTHIGFDNDKKVAAKIHGEDVIVGGHSHTILHKAYLNPSDSVPIVQTGSRGMFLGRLDLWVENKKVVQFDYNLIPIVPQKWKSSNSSIDRMIQVVKDKVAKAMDVVVGRSGKLIDRSRRPEGPWSSSLLGNFLADVMRLSVSSDIAFQNQGGVRGNIREGEVKYRDLYQVSPFGNTIVTMSLTGKQLRALLEISQGGVKTPMEVSGLKYEFDPKAPSGHRLGKVWVGKKIMKAHQSYKIATNSFLAGGRDGYEGFKDGRGKRDTGIKVRDAVRDYFKKNSPVSPVYENRRRVKARK